MLVRVMLSLSGVRLCMRVLLCVVLMVIAFAVVSAPSDGKQLWLFWDTTT